jgi:integrase
LNFNHNGHIKNRLDREIARICKEEGWPVPAPWRIHDLRRSCATHMGKIGIDQFTIGKVLNPDSPDGFAFS